MRLRAAGLRVGMLKVEVMRTKIMSNTKSEFQYPGRLHNYNHVVVPPLPQPFGKLGLGHVLGHFLQILLGIFFDTRVEEANFLENFLTK